MKEIHVVGAAIIEGRKVLVAKRSEKMASPLKWEFPGGKVEDGETHSKALEREVFEELGVGIRVNDFLSAGCSEFKDNRIVLHVYEAELISGEPNPMEHTRLAWMEIDQLNVLDWAEADIPVYRKLMKKYGYDYGR